mmetsp:Transcript_23137/g.33902  ORF Transcript_23137/g.33902 Transcript_23137/m.33902 type:complete len:235 (+) Transcript_23137:658-1362(+)
MYSTALQGLPVLDRARIAGSRNLEERELVQTESPASGDSQSEEYTGILSITMRPPLPTLPLQRNLAIRPLSCCNSRSSIYRPMDCGTTTSSRVESGSIKLGQGHWGRHGRQGTLSCAGVALAAEASLPSCAAAAALVLAAEARSLLRDLPPSDFLFRAPEGCTAGVAAVVLSPAPVVAVSELPFSFRVSFRPSPALSASPDETVDCSFITRWSNRREYRKGLGSIVVQPKSLSL